MKKIIILATTALMLAACCNNNEQTTETMKQELTLTQEWDKVFPLSDKVNHKKVTFETQYGLTLAADLYIPKEDRSQKTEDRRFAAIAVSGPFGATKEQSSGLYAMRIAERGFVTVAFDPSYTGESSGEPRRTASPDINTEDFMAAVDFLSKLENVDAEKIGVIGTQAYANSRFLYYINEIRSAVLVMHGENAHPRYFGEAAYKYMVEGQAEGYNFVGKPNPVPENKQLLIIPGALHCDLYDGGEGNYIPWDKLEEFFKTNLK